MENKGNTQKQYDSVFDQAEALFKQKAGEYGTSWRAYRPLSMMFKLQIKADRIRSIQEKREQLVTGKGNSIQDEFFGLLNYSVAALIHMEKYGKEKIPLAELTLLYAKHRQEITALMQKKNHDYGEAWRKAPMCWIADEISCKLARIRQVLEYPEKEISSEGVDANYQDIANYAAFALILISEGKDPMK